MSSFAVLKLEYSACVEALNEALRAEDETAFFAAVDHIVHMREPGMFGELRKLTGHTGIVVAVNLMRAFGRPTSAPPVTPCAARGAVPSLGLARFALSPVPSAQLFEAARPPSPFARARRRPPPPSYR